MCGLMIAFWVKAVKVRIIIVEVDPVSYYGMRAYLC